MKSRTTKLWGGATVVALALGGLLWQGAETIARAQSRPSAPAARGQWLAGIEGVWRVMVTQQNCDTGAPLGSPFHSLLAFVPGGTMSGTTSNPAFQPGQRSSDFGVWNRTGKTTYAALSEALIGFSGGMFVTGSQIITHQIEITDGGAGLTDAAKVQFFDGNGAVLTAGCATGIGQRFE